MSEETKIDGRTREGRAQKAAQPEAMTAAERAAKRAAEIRAQRVGRSKNLEHDRFNLGINGDLDTVNYEYRWVNDNERGRLARMQQRGWDIVRSSETGLEPENATETELGDAVSVVTGGLKTGEPMRSYLCAIPKEIADEVREAKRIRNNEQMTALAAGRDEKAGMAGDKHFYNAQVEIGRGS
ncbi:MAG: hypothetical protein GOVbin1573_50 [Prokaryotic dsDNA virus sp.]|nr:MAG: hypothetical protein GOVbin1573_50 [Prokaryotic dsDNA virus sp.]|tara:strand:+ start:2075 stop:2623 length:549 start_codon:yes stop_codon:yes gene_type:complete